MTLTEREARLMVPTVGEYSVHLHEAGAGGGGHQGCPGQEPTPLTKWSFSIQEGCFIKSLASRRLMKVWGSTGTLAKPDRPAESTLAINGVTDVLRRLHPQLQMRFYSWCTMGPDCLGDRGIGSHVSQTDLKIST